MPLRTSQTIWVVLYFILFENLPSLYNSILPPTYWGTLHEQKSWRPYNWWESRHWAHFSPRQVSVQCDSREIRFCTTRMVKTWQGRSLILTERLILNSSYTQAKKKKTPRDAHVSTNLHLGDINVCSTGLYKLSQKDLWSDTSPWCSFSLYLKDVVRWSITHCLLLV